MSKQPPPAPTARAIGPCSTIIQISRTPRHWKFTQHHRTTRLPPPPPPRGWFGGAMVLGKLPLLGRPTIWVIVGQGLIALAVGSGGGCLDIFVAPALAGIHRRASFRPFVRQHLTWVSCECNSSYSFAPIVLKLCMCLLHGMRMCMWIGHNCWISFCHLFDIVNLVIFHPDYMDSGSDYIDGGYLL